MRLPNIPAEVFAARPLLKAVQAAAHDRCVVADSTLWTFFVIAAAFVPARVSVETGVGTPVRPTLFAVLAGDSGTGKTASVGTARALVPHIPMPRLTRVMGASEVHSVVPEPLPLSTGQGLVEAYYDRVAVEQAQPAGKPPKVVMVRRRVRSNAWFYLDEGEALFKEMEKPGSVTRGDTSRILVGRHGWAGERERGCPPHAGRRDLHGWPRGRSPT
jgi:hypothetical protein